MFLYCYYSLGNGAHESTDDVAIIRAWTLKQAKKRLRKYVNLEMLDNYTLYKLYKFNKDKVKFLITY